jgi:tetratricopeptide (TPR) repeat protein
MIEEALEHYRNGNYSAAEVLYRKMLEDEPDNPEVLFMLSLVRQGQDDFEEPVDLLTRALRVQPENPSLHYTLGSVQLRRRKLAEAEQAFHKATGIDPNFVEAQNGIATVELARGRFAAAEHALRKALKSDPNHIQALINMGVALLEQGKTDDAIGYLQQVTMVEPDNTAAQVHLGRAFVVAGSPGFAIRCFENALDQKPDSKEVLKLLASARMETRQFKEAAENYRRVLFLGEELPETVASLARAEYALDNFREAEGVFLRAMRLAPNQEGLTLDFARLLLEQGRNREVIQRLEGKIESAEDPDRMCRLVAEAKLASGDTPGAMELLRPMLSEGALSDDMRLLFARALLASGEREAADAQIDRLLEAEMPQVDAVQLRVREHLEDGDLESAIEHLRAIQRRLDLKPRQRLKAVALLADTLHKTGQYQAAWEQLIGLEQREAETMVIRLEQPLQMESNEPAESAMERDVAWAWPPQPPADGRPEPIFVFAWPGAGREDLLWSLASHPNIVVVNDNVAAQEKRRLLISHPQGKGPLNQLTIADIQLARRRYWKALRQADPMAGSFNTVDSAWLTVEAFPTIYRIFPQAQVIILGQDPRDMMLSWLQSGYGDLAQMAKLYSGQLALLERCRAGVPLNYIDIDSQHLLANPAGTLREMISSLSLAWDPIVEDAFNAGAKRDLAERGAWEHYAEWLQPELEALGIKKT